MNAMHAPDRILLFACFCVSFALRSIAIAGPPPTQVFYVPFPEDNQLAGFSGINGAAVDPLAIFVTFSAATDNTVIYYDHWEDGYERDITNPVQSTSLVFGDGNPANGYPPGNAGDLIPAGTVFSLRNYVESTTLQSVLDYDARDKVASYKPISLTKTSFPASTNTLLAGCVEVFEQGLWGTEYRVPVGEDMPTSTATASLTTDADIFAYTSLSIMAGAKGATVQIDADNNGSFEQTVVLAEGETSYVTEVNTGAKVLADKPVQVVMFSGRPGSNYQSRDTMLLPTYRWSTSYYAPVSTTATNGTAVFLYNPGTSAITVSYDYRSSPSAYTTATVDVPAGGNTRVNLTPANGTSHFGAYRFYTTGATPPVFYAFSAVDSTNAGTTNNQAYDGGFTLVGQPSLTTQILLSLGIGRDPYSATNPAENGNPVWITTAGNGHVPATIYVDFDGDNAGPLTDPNGNKYDVSYSLRELEQQQIFDPDGDQSGMLVYSLDPAIRIAAAWAQDPTLAAAAQPGLDVSTLIPPLREGEAGKKSNLDQDGDGDGHISAGDVLEYELRAVNSARAAIPGPFAVQDTLPVDVTYEPGSTRYRFSVGGAWQAWENIADDASGTPFPLDGTGFSVPGNLGTGQQLQVVFKAAVKNYAELNGDSITNQGTVEISPYGLLLPIEWTDTIYGSIGDVVWNDLSGDGVQDPGEAGIAGIRVFADLNNNGQRDAGEPQSVTDSNGFYLLGGLTAGNYLVRVNPADISAANLGYGPTYDLDGIDTSHLASVSLAGAQDRVDADFGYRVGASVGDRVWMDRDADGAEEDGEPGISGVRVYVDLNDNDAFDAGEPNTITGADGLYYIGNLDPGTYAVRVDTATLPSGANQTYDLVGALDHEASVTLIAAEHRGDLDFGYRGTLSLGNEVWEDVDGNGLLVDVIVSGSNGGMLDMDRDGAITAADAGVLDGYNVVAGRLDVDGDGAGDGDDDITSNTFLGLYRVINGRIDINLSGSVSTADVGRLSGEQGIANVRIYIDVDNDGIFDSTEPSAISNSSGIYTIGNLYNGSYIVRVDASTLPASYFQTYDLTAPADDHAASVTLSGGSRTDVDFGYRNDATIGDLVWNDRDSDGVRDPGEPGIEGVLVYIDADGDNLFDQGLERFGITDVNGFYQIENLAAGSYAVRVEISTLPQGGAQTHDLDGGLDNEAARTLAVSEAATDVDFGYRSAAGFGDFVWNDSDADGVQDVGESGISGVRVYADINGNGAFDSATEPSAITDSNGTYSIANLMPGTYTARVDAATLPAGLVLTFDAVGALDGAATFFVSASQTRVDIDFGFTAPVAIGDFVWNDLDVDGQQDSGEPGLENVTVTVFNAATDTEAATTTTDGNGFYSFPSLLPGTYYVVFESPAGFNRAPADSGADTSDSDADAVTGRTPDVTLIGGQSDPDLDAGFFQPGSIAGSVLADTDADGDGDIPLEGVALALLDASGTPVTDGFGSPVTTTTAADGSYLFGNLPPGTYQIAETQPGGYGSVADADGGNLDLIGDVSPVVLAPGLDVTGRDFVEIKLGTISGYVLAGSTPLSGITLTLLDQNGDPVDGAPNSPGMQPFLAVTDALGYYSFKGVVPGVYQVSETQPYGYDSFGDLDGGDLDVIGDVAPITILPGAHSQDNNFVETLDTCPDDWNEWKFQHPGETAAGNPDADAYDNLAEFAFAMPYDSGTASPWLGRTAWIIQPSTLNPDTIEAVFVRPKGAPANVAYTLEYAAAAGNPTVWLSIGITPVMFSAADNGDCTETITIHDLENLTGLTGGKGFVRIRADLDDNGGGDGDIDHSSFTEVEGWTATDLEICCRTYNNPYQRETLFSGTVSLVSGQELSFTSSVPLDTLLAPGASHYIEVVTGDHEGLRFDVGATTAGAIVLANDSDIHAAAAPFNTIAGAPPASLAGDQVALRRHWTLDELFPPASFGATGSQSTADQVQLFAADAWTIYWLYDENDADPLTARWVDAADSGMADQGATVIPPGQGLFFNNRDSATSILSLGEVRGNAFIRPLAIGNNLVAGGYPTDQSANGPAGRQMSLAAGFFGSRDFKTADSFFLWNADATLGAKGYATYFLLNGAPTQPSFLRWVKVGDVSLLARDAEVLLHGNRSVFVRSKDGLDGYTVPSPWTP